MSKCRGGRGTISIFNKPWKSGNSEDEGVPEGEVKEIMS